MASGAVVLGAKNLALLLNRTNPCLTANGSSIVNRVILLQCRFIKSDPFGERLERSRHHNPKVMGEVDEIGLKAMMKKNRMYAQYNYQEWRFPTIQRPVDISCTRMVAQEYEDKSSLMTRLRDPRKELQDKRIDFLSNRAIKKKVKSFHRKRFPTEAQEIYVKVHELLNSDNWTLPNKKETEESLHGLVTELAYPKIIQGLANKTVNWKFVESIEPPRTVQIRVVPMMHEDNVYGQVTVRFHTKQLLTLYDRFGRLMMGSLDQPRDILEYVTFERHLIDPYGKWRIHGKKLVENRNQDVHEKCAMNRVECPVETPFSQLTEERKWRLKRASAGISIRIRDALSCIEMSTCDSNSIGLIIEDICHD